MVLMVAVVYRKRALPLVWLVYRGKKGHTTAERHIEVLEKLKILLPEEAEVVLMGDADDSYDFLEIPKFVEQLRIAQRKLDSAKSRNRFLINGLGVLLLGGVVTVGIMAVKSRQKTDQIFITIISTHNFFVFYSYLFCLCIKIINVYFIVLAISVVNKNYTF